MNKDINKMNQQIYKFRGNVRIGILITSWPNGILEVSRDALILRDLMLKREIKLSKDEIEKIEIRKFFPIVGYSIRIFPKNKLSSNLSFGYWSFKFDKLINALKEFNYL